MGNRIDYIDIAKALGLMMVIGVHCEGAYRLYSGFYIPLFFVLSGYTSIKEMSGALVWHRFRKLILPYLFFSAFCLVCYRHFDLQDFWGVLYARFCLYPLGAEDNLFFLRSNNMVLWFLPAMFSAYVLYYFIDRCKKVEHKILMVSLFVLISYLLTKLPILLPWSLDTAFAFAIMIFVGNLMRKYELPSRYGNMSVVLSLLLVCILAELEKGGTNVSVRQYGGSIMLFYVTAILGSSLSILLAQWLEKTCLKKFLVEVGKHTLVIFSIQMFILDRLFFVNRIAFETCSLPHSNLVLIGIGLIKVLTTLVIGLVVAKVVVRIFPFLK